jgi:hypothetical protein
MLEGTFLLARALLHPLQQLLNFDMLHEYLLREKQGVGHYLQGLSLLEGEFAFHLWPQAMRRYWIYH